jgi:hypothetical protein
LAEHGAAKQSAPAGTQRARTQGRCEGSGLMMEIAVRSKGNPALSRVVRNFARKFVGKRGGGNVVSQSGGGTAFCFAVRAALRMAKTPTTTSPSGALTSGVTHSKSWSQRQARLSAASSS